ncbi:MAG: hypothetical protein KIB43_08015 [Clostridium baratii]|uniref:hypothetical protein n=1 Tax=Clostridium baratii TaxID=1561 RepID=UPI00242F7C21|nr:hypothetical protein [Clostridium baratii]MBS6006894.1 hypothetical protein [Clostridium baratii]MDU1053430.1 hypothetical protein [Clostridium baratii]
MINNQIKIFEKDNFRVQTKIESDGSIGISAKDTAIGFGLTQIKNDKEYIRWVTLNKYLKEFGYSQQVGKDDFIPESLFYLIGMKTNNEMAQKFQTWLATEVIPSIRRYGAYIAPDANKEIVDKLEKFSKYRIKRTFTNATKENIESLYNDFLEFIPTMKATDSITAISSAIKGITEFRTNTDSDAYKMLTLEKIKELTDIKATKQNRVNGAIKSHKTRKINSLSNFAARIENEAIELENQLQEWIDYANSLYPPAEEFIEINYHPFSFNYMYEKIDEDNDIKERTKGYNYWIHKFPSTKWPELNPNKYYQVFLEFEHIEAFDTDNFIKATIDQIVRDTNLTDDNNIIDIKVKTTAYVEDYKDGIIRVCIRALN